MAGHRGDPRQPGGGQAPERRAPGARRGRQGRCRRLEPLGEAGAERLGAAYDQLATQPTAFSSRQKRLEGRTYGTATYQGKTYDRWQYEATAGGRIFYFVDDPSDGGHNKPQHQGRGPKRRRRVIIDAVHQGHPKGTERKRG